jgi:hypothetical protein
MLQSRVLCGFYRRCSLQGSAGSSDSATDLSVRARHVWLEAAGGAGVSADDLQHLIPDAGTIFHKGKTCGAVAAPAGRLREVFHKTDHAVIAQAAAVVPYNSCMPCRA